MCGSVSVFISLPVWEFTDTPCKAQTTVTWKNSRNSIQHTRESGGLGWHYTLTHTHTGRGVGNRRDTGSGSNCVGLTDIDTSEGYQLTHTDADTNSDTTATWVTLIDNAEPSQRAPTAKQKLSSSLWLLISTYWLGLSQRAKTLDKKPKTEKQRNTHTKKENLANGWKVKASTGVSTCTQTWSQLCVYCCFEWSRCV